jgi:hypothetical protein
MNFIAMLTHNDTTVPNADKIHEVLRACHHAGFRDVGATPDELAVVAEKAHADGLDVLREVVSRSEQSELAFCRRLPDRSRVSNGRYAHGERRAHACQRPCQLLYVPCRVRKMRAPRSQVTSGSRAVHIAGAARAPVGCSTPRAADRPVGRRRDRVVSCDAVVRVAPRRRLRTVRERGGVSPRSDEPSGPPINVYREAWRSIP